MDRAMNVKDKAKGSKNWESSYSGGGGGGGARDNRNANHQNTQTPRGQAAQAAPEDVSSSSSFGWSGSEHPPPGAGHLGGKPSWKRRRPFDREASRKFVFVDGSGGGGRRN
mmetsp:Transcript_57814/g.99548  ORF Transcript_57814/g.99548 Transcript_57814/m.99548 type:complete len:111 (+) Transcript_57814:89-421(+)